ncbi:S-adenosylmethionine decarboxylase [Crucibulum laeve]|uniref:adenosylmethionine decarboxylase n=1 Tax=Crucibulum laeve TaxID=68775 RepID=A0A5C3MGW1_9AGAR|nr:S-adenosylmethionine decarboxylase [Crucibulum laeve]
MADTPPDHQASAPFEGPEKLLEIWFAPSPTHLPDSSPSHDGRTGLRKVPRAVWEDMLDIVKCKVLSFVEGTEIDAYLLSESSFFVSPHRLILKTCGTTLNLFGLPRILEIAATEASLPNVHRCFYSRKSFMFPERQLGPHRDWKQEVEYLDNIFKNGAAYTIGKVNGDHWLLYMTTPDEPLNGIAARADCGSSSLESEDGYSDYTIEILMSDLSLQAREPFFTTTALDDGPSDAPSLHAQELSQSLGISHIFPPHLTTLDAYSFSPCGYSSNALIKWGDDSLEDDSHHHPHHSIPNGASRRSHSGEGYYTIHVTPEEGWSYASFECNIPLSTAPSSLQNKRKIPDLKSLVQRVVKIFQPGRLTLTLFISCKDNEADDLSESAVEAAQKAFKLALTDSSLVREKEASHRYKRTDKINYEFGGYDLAFASFELK